ncbi:MAG: site-2 protease family protein [Longicatena sp.]
MFDLNSFLQKLIYILPAVVISLSAHEFAHAFVSYKLGDKSQLSQGRMTLNPFKHLDPMGTLSLLFFGFGWAKPVQVDPYFYHNKKEGMMWTALAGPFMNFIVAFIAILIYGLMIKFGFYYQNAVVHYIFVFMLILAQINLGLGIFNLIPIPPLDGSKILTGILNEETYFKLMRYENYFMIVIMLLLATGTLNGPLFAARETLMNAFMKVVGMMLGMN